MWNCCKQSLGYFLITTASLLFGICNVVVKQMDSVGPFNIAVYRCLGVAIPALSIIIYRGETPLPRDNRTILLVRGLAGGLSIAAQYYGMKHMPIADANMISAASPIWTALMARVILKEPLGILDILNVILTILGLVFIIRPPIFYGYDTDLVVDDHHYIAAMIVFASTFLQAAIYIFLRFLKGVHYSVTLFNVGSVGAVVLVAMVEILGQGACIPPCGQTRQLLLILGFMAFTAQVFLTVALQLEEANKMSILRKGWDIIFSFLFQIFIFKEFPNACSISGAILVALAIFLNGAKKFYVTNANAAHHS